MGQNRDMTITFSPSRGLWVENIVKARSAIEDGKNECDHTHRQL